jgi:hypothetical protein
MYGKETNILQEVKKRIAEMEQANDLFNFYNKHKGEI